MHEQCFDFVRRVKTALPDYFQKKRVVEVGSLVWNDSIKPLFEDCDYVGLDAQPGDGVDVVASGVAIPFEGSEFDVSISCEVFEHTADWRAIVAEMKRVTKPGGLLIATAATTGRHAHGIEEHGFGHYENVRADELRRLPVGDELFFETDYVNCDVRIVWRVSGDRMEIPTGRRFRVMPRRPGFSPGR